MNPSSMAPESDTSSEAQAPVVEASVDDASLPYVGTWHKLVSSTNWEKGRIIATWREAQIAAGAEASAYSDEAWAQMVGDVTSQHVGRLRRVFDRFGVAQSEYPGLYWSHFHAALDWEDAEIWLEGAVQQKWSIAAMRRQRDQAHGRAGANAADADVISQRVARESGDGDRETIEGELVAVQPTSGEEIHDDDFAARDQEDSFETIEDDAPLSKSAAPKARPFANLPQLPDDLADAFESYKLAILHHKLTGWQAIKLADVLASLDALKQLAEAPSE